jgi:protein tyrosine phosphatase
LIIHRYRNQMTREQRTADAPPGNVEPLRVDRVDLLSSTNEPLILFMSKLPGRRLRHDIRNIHDDLQCIDVHTIVTLNEVKELSFMNMTTKNLFSMDIYAMHLKRANIEHLLYPIRDRFLPKSISDYIQFLFCLVMNSQRTNHNRLLVHCMGGMGRTGLTIVCLELMHEYLMKTEQRSQTFLERFCHYPFLLTTSCRVCQAIANVRRIRQGTIHNPLQIIFAHEVYARLKSSSYMHYIRMTLQQRETLLANNRDD